MSIISICDIKFSVSSRSYKDNRNSCRERLFPPQSDWRNFLLTPTIPNESKHDTIQPLKMVEKNVGGYRTRLAGPTVVIRGMILEFARVGVGATTPISSSTSFPLLRRSQVGRAALSGLRPEGISDFIQSPRPGVPRGPYTDPTFVARLPGASDLMWL